MNFRSRKWTVLLLFLLIILSLLIFVRFFLGFGSNWNIKGIFLNTFSKNPFTKSSELNASLSELKLNLDFKLTADDELKFNKLISNWFGTSEKVKALSIGIDENLKTYLEPVLPVDLNLKIEEKTLEFQSKKSYMLKNALVKNDFKFATGSGKFSLKYSDPQSYDIKIENPGDLVFYATSAGMLTVSDKLDGLFKSLPRLATIELSVNGKNISGSIKLK